MCSAAGHEMLHLRLLLFCYLLTLGDALDCRVSVIGDHGRSTYNISDLPQDSAGNWVYSWANSTHHVIANNKQEIGGLVLKNTNTSLHTSKFIEGIIFTGIILSTGRRYTAHCPISAENAQSWKNPEFFGNTFPPAAIAVTITLFVLLVIVVVVLLYKFRDKIPSCRSRSPRGVFALL